MSTISSENISKLLHCLSKANKESRDINSRFDERVQLWNAGLYANKMALPSLITIEARAVAAQLTARFRIHFNQKSDNTADDNDSVLFE